MTVEQMLDQDIDPSVALEVTGFRFQNDAAANSASSRSSSSRIDPEYLRMLHERRNQSDEELGMSGSKQGQLPLTAGYPVAEDLTQKLVQEKYENWLRMNLRQDSPSPVGQAKRQ